MRATLAPKPSVALRVIAALALLPSCASCERRARTTPRLDLATPVDSSGDWA
jgi:hypothetical protein